MNDSDEELAEGEYTAYEGEADQPEGDEIRLIAQVLLYLEHDVGVDVRRLHVRVKGGTVHIQGSVDTTEQKREIEESLPQRPGIRAVDSYLSVRDD